MSQTVILRGDAQRDLARSMISSAPVDAVVTIKPASRTTDQNAKLWAMLSDVSRAKPDGRMHTPEVWKALFMNGLGYQSRFVMGLDGEPFPMGFSTSRLSRAQFGDLITFVQEYGDRNEVAWNEPLPKGYGHA